VDGGIFLFEQLGGFDIKDAILPTATKDYKR
jgi:hypothetical protein